MAEECERSEKVDGLDIDERDANGMCLQGCTGCSRSGGLRRLCVHKVAQRAIFDVTIQEKQTLLV